MPLTTSDKSEVRLTSLGPRVFTATKHGTNPLCSQKQNSDLSSPNGGGRASRGNPNPTMASPNAGGRAGRGNLLSSYHSMSMIRQPPVAMETSVKPILFLNLMTIESLTQSIAP